MINAKNKMYPEALNNSEAMAVTARTLTVHVFLPSGRLRICLRLIYLDNR